MNDDTPHGAGLPGACDTGAEAMRVQARILRQLSVRARLDQVDRLHELTTALALADLRRRHPAASESELRGLLAGRVRLSHGDTPAGHP